MIRPAPTPLRRSRFSSAPRLVAVASLAAALAACESRATMPRLPPGFGEPPPIALDWVGRYRGHLEGIRDGMPLRDPGAELVIHFDEQPAPDCHSCVTVLLGEYFGTSRQRITQPVNATFGYSAGALRHTLTLGKFSANGGNGNALAGDLLIVDTTLTTGPPFLEATVLLERVP